MHPEQPVFTGGSITRSVRLESEDGLDERLWYRFPPELADSITDSLDPFVIGSIFLAMRKRADLICHGAVSPSLIRNLAEFQAYWFSNRPRKYARVQILADDARETVEGNCGDRAISTFTGGLDSSHTIYRHRSKLCGQLARNIEAALFVHGLDIPLGEPDSFKRTATINEDTLASLGVKLLTLATNQKEINPDWNETHGAGIASCLSFFSKSFNEGIIPGSYTYRDLSKPWGSNPVSDHLLSSRSFSIFHDGAVWTRPEKLIPLQDWKTGYDRLRVCFSGEERDKNCGRCGKCVITMLSIESFRLPMPASFPQKLTPEHFELLNDLDEVHIDSLEYMITSIPPAPLAVPHIGAIRRCLKENRKRLKSEEKRVANESGKIPTVLRDLSRVKRKLSEVLGSSH